MEVKKVVAIGDSLTEGYGVNNNDSWPFILETKLGVEVVNRGISGDTTAGMLSRFQTMVIDHKPSHVIITGGTNDVLFDLPFNQIVANILSMSRQARYNDCQVIIGLPPKSFLTIDESVFVSRAVFNKKIEDYRRILKLFCEDDGLPFVDFSLNLTSNNYQEDGLHVNSEGNAIMANTIFKYLITKL